MNNKLTALFLCFLMTLADALCLAKTLEIARLTETKIKIIVVFEILLAITLLYFVVNLAARIFVNRGELYRRFLPASFLKFDRSRFQSGFLKRQTSSLKV